MSTLSIGRYTIAPSASTASPGLTDSDASSNSLDGPDNTPAESGKWTAVTIEFSPAAQFYGKLQHLADSDPRKFKKVMGEMAAGLQDVARQSTGTDARAIANLSSEFAEASRTGSADPLAPSSLPAGLSNPYGALSAGSAGSLPTIMSQAVSPSDGNVDAGDDAQDLMQLGALFRDLTAQIGAGKASHRGDGYLA